MKNTMLQLKKIVCAAGITLLMAGSTQAQLVYSTDFDIPYSNSTGAIVLGGATPDVVAEEWFGSSNAVGVVEGDLSFSNTAANRFRGSGVWLDTTGWATGLVTVEVDVANFIAGADTSLIFQAYAATGVDASNSISLDLHGAVTAGAQPTATGAATISTLGSEQTITGDGTDVPFTFTYNGTDDFVGLTFVQVNAAGGAEFGSADLDNLTVTVSMSAGVLGDFDLDGDVDLDDLDQYNGNINAAATGALEALDLDGDGTVGANDFMQHYTDLVETSNGGTGTFAGDANLDGQVNVLGDAFLLVGNLGNASSSWSQGDFNGDGTVNVLGDAFLLVGNLGMDNGGGSAP